MEAKLILETQKEYFKTRATRDVGMLKKLLTKLRSEILAKEDAIYEAVYKDLKKSKFEAYFSEIGVVISEIDLTLKHIDSWSKPKKIRAAGLNFPSRDYIYSEPYGTVLTIAPWNYPFQLAVAPLIAAIAAGNTVVLKPSEHAPKTATLLAELIAKTFDPQHVTVVNGDASVAKELLDHRWDHIIFTGSTHVGKIIAKAAADHLTPTILELGGKNPCIVDATAPIQLTAKRIVWGKYVNCGQTCIAPDYLLVDESIKAPLLKALVEEIKNAYGEDASTAHSYGRIAHQRHFDRLVELIKGSDLVYGGDSDDKTLYFGPTLLEVDNTQHPTMAEEIFGPILPVLSYSNESELNPIIDTYERPLGFYVFSKRKKFIKNIFHRYSYGGGVANDTVIQFANDKLPFGGVGYSGLGAYHGKHSFDAFTHFKPFIKRGTWIDPFVRYAPYPSSFDWLKKLLNFI